MDGMLETGERDTYLAEFESFGLAAAAGSSGWLREIRQRALERFLELGFPKTTDEEWRFTSLAPVARRPFVLPRKPANGVKASDLADFTFCEPDCCQLVFLNGAFSRQLSFLKSLPKGVKVKSLSAALEYDGDIVERHLARQAPFEHHSFVALNTAFLNEGAFIYLPAGAVYKDVIHLLFVSTPQPDATMTHPRNLIVAGAGSQFTLIESHVGLNSGSYFSNSVTEIVAGEDSVIDYYRLQRESETGFHISSVHVVQERNSNFSAHSLSLGAALARNDFRVVLDAEGAECALNGLYAAQGRQHIDNHTWIDHAKPHCTSRELYKGILDHKSSAVFDGKILVRKDAQKTNSRQTNKNLLLSTEALVNSTPRLEIFADDVKCTHGATIGQLSEDELFYLRSRGIDGQTARTLLTYAFASDILSTVRIKPIQCQMDLLLLARLSRSGIDMRQFFAE
jgi:Fe-S cluster assembly protein SufD